MYQGKQVANNNKRTNLYLRLSNAIWLEKIWQNFSRPFLIFGQKVLILLFFDKTNSSNDFFDLLHQFRTTPNVWLLECIFKFCSTNYFTKNIDQRTQKSISLKERRRNCVKSVSRCSKIYPRPGLPATIWQNSFSATINPRLVKSYNLTYSGNLKRLAVSLCT